MLVPVILLIFASTIFEIQCQSNEVDLQKPKQLPRLISALDPSTENDKSSVLKIPAENGGIERDIETSAESRAKRSPGGGGCTRCGYNPGGGGHGSGGGGGGGGSWSKSSSSSSSGSWGGGGGKYHGRK